MDWRTAETSFYAMLKSYKNIYYVNDKQSFVKAFDECNQFTSCGFVVDGEIKLDDDNFTINGYNRMLVTSDINSLGGISYGKFIKHNLQPIFDIGEHGYFSIINLIFYYDVEPKNRSEEVDSKLTFSSFNNENNQDKILSQVADLPEVTICKSKDDCHILTKDERDVWNSKLVLQGKLYTATVNGQMVAAPFYYNVKKDKLDIREMTQKEIDANGNLKNYQKCREGTLPVIHDDKLWCEGYIK